MDEADKPPPLQNSKRTRSSIGGNRVNPRDLYWIPIWKSANLQSLAIRGDTCHDNLYQYKVMDLVSGKDD